MHGKLISQKKTAWFIFPERHFTLLPNAFCFFKTQQSFDACIYVTVQITSVEYFRVSWKYSDLAFGEYDSSTTPSSISIKGQLAAGLINVSGIIFFLLPFKKSA